MKKILLGFIIALPLIGLGTAFALDTTEAQEKAKQTLNQITDPTNPQLQLTPEANPNIEDNRLQPVVPNIPDYGHDKKAVIDPIEVAERFKARSFDPTLKEETDLLVFVSFSLPEASLKRIAYESKKSGAVMVLRGMKDNSLRETQKAAGGLAALGAKVMIHPDLFTQYAVTEVPTFVLANSGSQSSCDDGNQCENRFAVKGDVSLHYVLDKFSQAEENAFLANAANTRLQLLKGLK